MASSAKKEETDLFDLLKDIGKNWHIMLPCLILSGILGVIAAMWIRPVYQADALLQIESQNNKGMIGAMMGGLGSLFASASPAETEIELIMSRQIIGETVDKMHLQYYATPTNIPQRLIHKEGRMDLTQFEIPWDSLPKKERGKSWFAIVKDSLTFDILDHKKNKVLSNCHAGETYSFPYAGDTASIRVENMKVKKGQRFKLSKADRLDAIEAFKGAFDIQERGKKTGILAFSYSDIYADRAIAVLNEITKAYLDQNIERSNVDAQKTLSVLESQLPDIKAQMDSAMARYNKYRNRVGSVDINAETRITLERRNRLQQELFSLQQKKQDAIRLFQPEHPTIKTYDEQENAIKRELANNSYESKRLPTTQQEVLKLENDVEMSKVMYTTLLNNIQQLKLVSAGEAGTARVIDYAEALTYPIKPKKKIICCIALFLGFLFGIALVSVKKRVKTGIRSANLVEQETGFSVYARIPKNSSQKATDKVSDAVRQLRRALEFNISEGARPIVGISSLTSGSGASFSAINLATQSANSGKKVLLIDADLRKGHIGKDFKINQNKGLSQLLMQEASLAEVLHSTEIDNLTILPCGSTPSNPSEILGSKRYAELVGSLEKDYDIIIIDTPPITSVTDAALACRFASQLVMVVEYSKHSISAIKEGVALLLKRNGDAHASIVINKYE